MKSESKNRILRSSGLTSDATRIIRNARATLHGGTVRHANGTSFAVLGGKTRPRTTATNGGKLTFLDSTGDQQPGYADVTEAAKNERQMRKMGGGRDLDEGALRKSRIKQHVANGLDGDTAAALAALDDAELDALCAGEDLGGADDSDDSDDDDGDGDADDDYNGPMAEVGLRMKQKQHFGADVDSDEARQERHDHHLENDCTESEARRLVDASDDELADEIEARRESGDDDDDDDDDTAKGDSEELAAAVEVQRRRGPTALTREQEILLERNGILQAYGRVDSTGRRLMCRGGVCWKVGHRASTARAACGCKGAA